MLESHGNQPNSTSRVLKAARDVIGVQSVLDGEETLRRAAQGRKPARSPGQEQIVTSQEQVMRIEVPNRVECLGVKTEPSAIHADLTL